MEEQHKTLKTDDQCYYYESFRSSSSWKIVQILCMAYSTQSSFIPKEKKCLGIMRRGHKTFTGEWKKSNIELTWSEHRPLEDGCPPAALSCIKLRGTLRACWSVPSFVQGKPSFPLDNLGKLIHVVPFGMFCYWGTIWTICWVLPVENTCQLVQVIGHLMKRISIEIKRKTKISG